MAKVYFYFFPEMDFFSFSLDFNKSMSWPFIWSGQIWSSTNMYWVWHPPRMPVTTRLLSLTFPHVSSSVLSSSWQHDLLACVCLGRNTFFRPKSGKNKRSFDSLSHWSQLPPRPLGSFSLLNIKTPSHNTPQPPYTKTVCSLPTSKSSPLINKASRSTCPPWN